MKKYYLDAFYDFSPEMKSGIVDYTIIGEANETDLARKPEDWKTETEAGKFQIYDSLEEAIKNAGVSADKITFKRLSKEDRELAKEIVEKMM